MVRSRRFECSAEHALRALAALADADDAPRWLTVDRRRLDTEGCVLSRAGLELLADVSNDAVELALCSRGGEVLQATAGGAVPRAVDEIGDFRLARQLSRSVREDDTLAVLAREPLYCCRLECRDDDGKSVGTLTFERATDDDAGRIAIRAIPKRGYADEFDRLLEREVLPLTDAEAARGDVDAAASPAATLGLLLGRCQRTLRDELAGVIAGHDIEALHEFRVAMRRARSLISGFSRHVPTDRAVVDDLRWLGRLTGPVRDLDVWAESLAATDDAPVFLVARVRSERERYRERLVAALASARYAAFERELDTWITRLGEDTLVADGEDFLAAIVLRHVRSLRRAIAAQEHRIPFDALHDLRKQAKKLRYLAEAAAELSDLEGMTRLVRPLKRLQDAAGEICDRYAHAYLVQRWLKDDKDDKGGRAERVKLKKLARRLKPPRTVDLRKRPQRKLRTRLEAMAAHASRRRWRRVLAGHGA